MSAVEKFVSFRFRRVVFAFAGIVTELILVALLLGTGFLIAWAVYSLFA